MSEKVSNFFTIYLQFRKTSLLIEMKVRFKCLHNLFVDFRLLSSTIYPQRYIIILPAS